jgi:hypothetical protein
MGPTTDSWTRRSGLAQPPPKLTPWLPFAPGLGASCAVFLAKCALNF